MLLSKFRYHIWQDAEDTFIFFENRKTHLITRRSVNDLYTDEWVDVIFYFRNCVTDKHLSKDYLHWTEEKLSSKIYEKVLSKVKKLEDIHEFRKM